MEWNRFWCALTRDLELVHVTDQWSRGKRCDSVLTIHRLIADGQSKYKKKQHRIKRLRNRTGTFLSLSLSLSPAVRRHRKQEKGYFSLVSFDLGSERIFAIHNKRTSNREIHDLFSISSIHIDHYKTKTSWSTRIDVKKSTSFISILFNYVDSIDVIVGYTYFKNDNDVKKKKK